MLINPTGPNRLQRCLLSTVLGLLVAGSARAAEPLILTDEADEFEQFGFLEYLPNSLDLELADVAAAPYVDQFIVAPEIASAAEDIGWIRLRVKNSSTRNDWRFTGLFPVHPVHEGIEFYIFSLSSTEASSEYRRVHPEPHQTTFATVLLDLEPGTSVEILMRRKGFLVYFELHPSWGLLQTFAAYDQLTRRTYLRRGILFGATLMLVLYHLLIFASLREVVYLNFALYLVCGILGTFYFTKVFVLFPPDFLVGSRTLLLTTLLVVFYIRFGQSYLNTRERNPTLHKLLYLVLCVMIVSTVASFWGIHFLGLQAGQSVPIARILLLAAAITSWRAGFSPARFFVAGEGVKFILNIPFILVFFSVLPFREWTIGFWGYWGLAGNIVWTWGLADRLNFLREADERSRIAREESARKSAFLASMAHDLRTPLNAIKGFTNLVLRRVGEAIPERQRENLQKVDQASDHLLAQINDLMDLSKIEAGRMEVNAKTFDVGELITSCASTVSPLVQDGVSLVHECDGVGEAHTDEQRLRQMVINLLSNAIKFTDEGSVRVEAARRREELVISVSDTGKGIPEEEIATLFDEYRQVKGQSESKVQRGTGLGLSITKKFAELLGGSIGVESEVGKGSTFTVRVPMEYQVD